MAWLPELAGLHPAELAHQPWTTPPEALAAAGVRLVESVSYTSSPETASKGLVGAAAPREEAGAAGAQQQWQKGQEEAGMAGGGVYPLPMVDPATQLAKGPKQKGRQR